MYLTMSMLSSMSLDETAPGVVYVQQAEGAGAAAGMQHVSACARRGSRSPEPSPYSVFSPVVRKVSQEIPAGSPIEIASGPGGKRVIAVQAGSASSRGPYLNSITASRRRSRR